MDSKPRGRTAVWIGVLVVALILLVTFIARPIGSGGGEGEMVRPATSQSDVASSTAPGAADRLGANQPVAPQTAPTQTAPTQTAPTQTAPTQGGGY